MLSTEKAIRCMPISLGSVGCDSIALGWMAFEPGRRARAADVASCPRPHAPRPHAPGRVHSACLSADRTIRCSTWRPPIGGSKLGLIAGQTGSRISWIFGVITDSRSYQREWLEMNNQTAVVEDLDRFRDLLRILAAGFVTGSTVRATNAAGVASIAAR